MTVADLRFSGEWVDAVLPNARWSGNVGCDEAVVALLVGRSAGRVTTWAKSGVFEPPGSPVVLDVHPLSQSGPRAQLILHVAGAWLQNLVVALPARDGGVRTLLPTRASTGAYSPAFAAESEPPVELGLLFLARVDVRMGRTGIWRPRQEVEPLVPADLLGPLRGDRSGSAVFDEP